ncbi:hydroxypyruvate reductase [Allgaiera indica]|uniref:Hydroxypyruvate reductase n=2 Tax=Allgaiera indica TaxID=765699 RepID=A0AAN4USX8_9RHOB|nr:hydroxypyruvate reductase [Allgaiera indica]SDX24860.1 hydroxypyruvate reductase [Allgaiera indica]
MALDGARAGRQVGAMMDATRSPRDTARQLFMAGVAAADPSGAVRRALQEAPVAAPPGGRLAVIAVGKAALGMARAAMAVARPDSVLVVTNYENAADLPGAEVLAAGHPVPDAQGEAAARRVEALLGQLGPRDRVLALISGGGSALLPAPVQGLTLEDKAQVNRLLLASGAEITEMNLVRQQLSRLKGGGLLRAAAPAGVTALILSDVIGDDLRVIASGPTVAPIGTRAEALAALRARGVWDDLPESVRAHLTAPAAQLDLPEADNRLIGSNPRSVAAMASAAPEAGVIEAPLVGDVAEAAARIASLGPGTWLMGGETTVVLRGTGRGGRNQELALRVALLARDRGWAPGWVFLSGGTDGRDGPTDAAGGIVDAGTLGRIRGAGLDPEALLARNDSHAALQAAGDLLITGATGTNVADLQVLIRP